MKPARIAIQYVQDPSPITLFNPLLHPFDDVMASAIGLETSPVATITPVPEGVEDRVTGFAAHIGKPPVKLAIYDDSSANTGTHVNTEQVPGLTMERKFPF